MEAATAARRGGLLLLAQSRPGCSRARARTWGRGMGVGYPTPSAARRRLLVACVGVRESLPVQSLGEEAVAVEVDEDADDSAELLPSPDAPAKTVRVKFVLEKECAFGQQFFVVGDDQALGLWDPAKATVLDWSEGHVWTVKTDLPANKSIEFKFLLRDAAGHVRWQHGGNRTLQTTDTPNTLVVHEDWDHAGNQRVAEEEELSIAAEDVTFSDDLEGSTGAMLADELRTGENLEINASAVAEGEMKGANEDNSPQFFLEEDQKILNELHGKADTAPKNGYPAVADTSLRGDMTGANEDKQPQFILQKDQNILNEVHGIGKADAAPQNGYPSDDDNARQNEDDTAMCQEDAQIIVNTSTSIFENDLAWARKALQQLLRFLAS